MKNRVVHFEVHAENPERAMKFYKEIFQWEFKKWGEIDYWMLMTAEEDSQEPGINGGLMLRKTAAPKDGDAVNAFVCTINVESVDEMMKKIEAAGGTLALPKMAIPGMGWLAYYKDTEGNIFGIVDDDKEAK